MELNIFSFNRKGNGKQKVPYKALQFATPKEVILTRGKSAGKRVIKLDIEEYVKLDEATIRKMINAQGIDFRKALILGANLSLRRKASGGGMQDEIVLRLHKDGILSDEKDEERRATGLRGIATSILTLFREKSRMGKDWSLDKCYDMVVS
jgi:hypothetical protein